MKEQYSSFIEFKKDVFPNLCKKEQEVKEEAKKSICDKLWEIFINGFKRIKKEV